MSEARESGRLDGRVALVTGGARGIGAAIVADLVSRGARVVIADSGGNLRGEHDDPEVAIAAALPFGAQAAAFAGSIATPEGAAAAVAVATERFGGLDIVVNNAAILRDALIFRAAAADWEAMIATNLSGAYHVLAAASRVLRDQAKEGRGGTPYGWGRIINITSTAGFYGNYGQAAYASTKAGLLGLTRVAALDLARANVTCNALAPFAATRVTEAIQPANDAQATYQARALKVGARHVATVVAWLASPAAQSITGQLFGVRGREVFLFAQPRPKARLLPLTGDWDVAGLAEAAAGWEDQFTPLTTDLEAFNTEPYV